MNRLESASFSTAIRIQKFKRNGNSEDSSLVIVSLPSPHVNGIDEYYLCKLIVNENDEYLKKVFSADQQSGKRCCSGIECNCNHHQKLASEVPNLFQEQQSPLLNNSKLVRAGEFEKSISAKDNTLNRTNNDDLKSLPEARTSCPYRLCASKAAEKYTLKQYLTTNTGVQSQATYSSPHTAIEKSAPGMNAHTDKLNTYEQKPVEITRFPCNFCDYRARDNWNLSRHVKKVHTEGKQRERRPKLNTDNTPPVMRFFCHYCSYRSQDKWSLTRHTRTHTGEKPYSCHLCDFRSSRKEEVKGHIENIHKKLHSVR